MKPFINLAWIDRQAHWIKLHQMMKKFCLIALGLIFTSLVFSCAPKSWHPERRSQVLQNLNEKHPGESITFVNESQFGKEHKVEKYQLENGFTVILLEDHTVPIFSYQTWYRVGSGYEHPGITGIAHLFEHLMFRMTSNRKEGEFDDLLEKRGAQINAGTSRDWTYYYQNIGKDHLDLVANLEADRMVNVVLNKEQLEAERGVVKNERLFRIDNSVDGLMYEQLYAHAFQKSPYRWPIIGSMEDIEGIALEQCIDFYKRYYSPNNATLVIVGDINPEEALKTLQRHYGKIPKAQLPPPPTTNEATQKGEKRIVLKNKPIAAEKFLLGFHTPKLDHSDITALEILNAILLDGKSSRLYRRMVSEMKIASAVGGNVDSYRMPGLYKISISMTAGHTASEGEKIVNEELGKLINSLVDERELEKAKNTAEGYLVRIQKTHQHKAWMLGYYETLYHDYKKMFDELDKLRAVTREDVQAVAKKYLSNPNQRTIIIAKPIP
jgi:zinc protease